jgi:hypothetical protein
MVHVDVAILLAIAVIFSADRGWSGFRDWRARRLQIKRGRTLTTKFGLPPP